MQVYVQHEVLARVADVFNAEALWQAPGLALFARRPLLRDLLERSPREHRGRAATRCFSHVTLMLPQEEVDDDRHLTRGARVRELTASLAALHQKDFGDLLGGDQVRYDVVGGQALQAGQVEVKFGHAVYLPAPGEQPLYAVSASRDGLLWAPVCPIYPDQRLALIGQDAALAGHAVPGWPFGDQGAVLLINDGPQAPIEVQLRPRESFDCVFDPIGGHHIITSKRAGDAARLLLKMTRTARTGGAARTGSAGPARIGAADAHSGGADAAPGRPAAVWKARAGNGDGEPTAVPPNRRRAALAPESDATYAPVAAPSAGPRVSLVALALPRLSRYRESGTLALEIGFDRTLALAAAGQPALIGFALDAADTLNVVSGAGRERVSAPASFTPLEGATLTLLAVAPEMAERYCATLTLARPLGAAVAGGARFVFGRSAPMLAALRVLDGPHFLRRADGGAADSADRLGLSRSAFSFEVAPGGYRIGRLSPTQALYHLDAALDFVAAIDADAPYLLPSGHHLVAGHYVLRFDA